MHLRIYVLGFGVASGVVCALLPGCSSADPDQLTTDVQTTSDDLRARCRHREESLQSRCISTCTPWGSDDDGADDGTPRLATGCDAGATPPPTTTSTTPPPPPPTTTSTTPPPPPPTTTSTTPPPPPPPATCTSFTYSAWGACQANGTQTRTVTSSSPAGCTGGSPATSQSCTYIDGAALYTQYCSGCHGNSKKGSSVTSITNAINNNTGGMGSLKTLTSAQIAAISAAP